MRISMVVLAALLGALGLTACSEPEQTRTTNARKVEGKVWEGHTGPPAYVANGWNVGDEASWQRQIQDRTQRGQNEYNRTSAAR